MTGRVKGSLTPHRTGPPLLEVDPPDQWRARFGGRPAADVVCTGCPDFAALAIRHDGPHVHDRNGTAHPVTPDGRHIRTQENPT